jgi:hypothetical protein
MEVRKRKERKKEEQIGSKKEKGTERNMGENRKRVRKREE